MDVTVFYAWQDDRPGKLNRYLIRDAANDACQRISDDPGNDFTVHLDQDTQGRPGMCDIPNTILEKIRDCDVLLADLTFVGRTEAEAKHQKQISNPNVLMELGYAVGCKATDESDGFERVIGVMNAAYGKAEEQMFDIKRRRPIAYELPEGSDKDQIQRVTKSLSKSIEDALRTILNEVVSPDKGEAGARRFQSIRDRFEASVRDGSFHGIYHESGAIAICLVPDVAAKLDHKRLQEQRLHLISRNHGELEIHGRSVLLVGKYGLSGSDEGDRGSLVEVTVDGTVLAADVVQLYPEGSRKQADRDRIIHANEVEHEVVRAVTEYASVLHNLGVSSPWRLGVSLLAVRGYRTPPPAGSYASRSPNSHESGKVPDGTDDLVADPAVVLRYEEVASNGATALLLKGCFDYFSRECGYPQSFSYDANGNWKGPQ